MGSLTKIRHAIVVAALCVAYAAAADRRPFHLGFTTWPPDKNEQAVEAMYSFIARHGDLIALHFDSGVPWPEAFEGKALPSSLMRTWSEAKRHQRAGAKLYVAITPLDSSRTRLADAWKETDNQPLQPPWSGYALNDPRVKTAYVNYARRVIDYFKPDYLAFGIEVNIAQKKPAVWRAYRELHAYVYQELKKSYPSLPLFATWSLAHLDGKEGSTKIAEQRQELASMLPYEDIVAVSAYPYGFAGRQERPVPDDFFKSLGGFEKPVAVSETGCPSQSFTAFFFHYTFSEEAQSQCVQALLDQAEKGNFVFLINWSAIDSDKLLPGFPWMLRNFGELFAYTGLETSDGRDKPALTIWDGVVQRPYGGS